MKQIELIKKLKSCSSEKAAEVVARLKKIGPKYNVYPLSPEQERMAFLQLYTQYGKYAYICPYEIEVDTEEKMNRVAEAVLHIVKTHEIFRTLYFSIQGTIFQTVCPEDDFEIQNEYYDKSQLYASDPDRYDRFIASLYETPFEFETELTIRLFRVKKTEELYSVYIILHHINHDAWTIGLMIHDIEAYLEGKQIQKEGYTYLDYVHWKNGSAVKNKEAQQLEYWKAKLKDSADQKGFRTITEHHSEENGYLKEYFLDREMDCQIHAFCDREKISESNYFLAVFFLVLSFFMDEASVNIGTLTLNRSDAAFFDTYGFFVNTVVLNCRLDPTITFTEYLQSVAKTSIEALENQDVSFDKVVDAVCSERYSEETPLIHAMYGFYGKNLLGTNLELHDFEFKNLTPKKAVQQVLFLTVEQYTEKTGIGFIFNTDKLTVEWSDRFVDEYNRILKAVVQAPDTRIEQLKNKKLTDAFAAFERQYIKDDVPKGIGHDSEIADSIAALLCETIGSDEISYDESFFKLGCNSMSSIQLLEKINEKYGIELQIADIFRFSTIHLLSGYVKSLITSEENTTTIFEEF